MDTSASSYASKLLTVGEKALIEVLSLDIALATLVYDLQGHCTQTSADKAMTLAAQAGNQSIA